MRRTTDIPRAKPAILTCDPSLTAWGWAVLEGNLVRDHGCIKTDPEAKKRKIREGDDMVRRTRDIIQALVRVINKHNVTYIVTELPHGSQNSRGAIMIGIVMGIMESMNTLRNIPVEYYSEADAKKAVVGRISATKKQIIEAVDELYEVKWQYKTNGKPLEYYNEAVADSLAIYYCAECSSPTLKFMNQ